MATKKSAIVCGGGIAGLSTAIALSKIGWSVDVFERSDAIREIGAGIFIKGNGLRVLDTYGILEELRRDCIVLQKAQILDREGTVLQQRPLTHPVSVWNIKRQNLIRTLTDCARANGAEVHTSSPVDKLSPDGTVSVNGTTARADLVVAADGVNSLARRTLGLDRKVSRPRSGAIRLLIPRTEFEAADMTREFWSGRLRVGVAPCTATEVYSYLAAPLDDIYGAHAPIDANYWAERFPELKRQGFFERADVAGGVHHPYPFVGATNWVKGRVALVGDAVHGLPPTLGQGAGLSLMNTFLLAATLAKFENVDEALKRWEADWRWVSDRTQTWARRYDWITSEWPPSAYLVRNAIIWAIGKSRAFNKYMRVADRVDAPCLMVLK